MPKLAPAEERAQLAILKNFRSDCCSVMSLILKQVGRRFTGTWGEDDEKVKAEEDDE